MELVSVWDRFQRSHTFKWELVKFERIAMGRSKWSGYFFIKASRLIILVVKLFGIEFVDWNFNFLMILLLVTFKLPVNLYTTVFISLDMYLFALFWSVLSSFYSLSFFLRMIKYANN